MSTGVNRGYPLHFDPFLNKAIRREMGNGAKAQQKRERNIQAQNSHKGSKSQLKINQASKNIICQACKQPFMSTTRAPALEDHSKSKHNKTLAECFPGIPA